MTLEMHGAPATPRNAENEHLYQLPAAYRPLGPYVDNLAPEVLLIRDTAKAAGYPMGNVYPGLILIVGSGGTHNTPHEMFVVGFDKDNRFMFASSALTLCGTLDSFLQYLRDNPAAL